MTRSTPPAGPVRHPDGDLLADFACGQLDPARRVLLETHLARCSACRPTVAEMARPGARFLEKITPSEPPSALFDRILAEVADQAPPREPEDATLAALPAAAREEIDPRALADAALRWRRVPFTDARFAYLRRDPSEVDLIAVELGPSRRFPRHRHRGSEQAVIVAGGYTDYSGVYELGDFASYPAGSEHSPLTHADGPCRLVTRVVGGVRFRGWLGVVQRIGEIWSRRRR